MTRAIDSILDIVARYDAIVFDQWGVLHNGSAPYPFALEAIAALGETACTLGVLTNSGKSADINRDRITAMGFAPDAFGPIMTSGEALRLDVEAGKLGDIKRLFAITAKPGDAHSWASGLPLEFSEDVADADAVLLMGLPDGDAHEVERAVLKDALARGKPLICSNPDRTSPRADGVLVVSPGALAHEYADAGGNVTFYGKPHRPVFDALSQQLNAKRILMVGDSPEHDIAGANSAGWDSLFIHGGIHASNSDMPSLFQAVGLPDYILSTLR